LSAAAYSIYSQLTSIPFLHPKPENAPCCGDMIPFNIKVENISICKIYKVCHCSIMVLLICYIIKFNIYLVNKSAHQILELYHATAIYDIIRSFEAEYKH
jgi:hypothetical protein